MVPFRTQAITSSRLRLNVLEWGDPDAVPVLLIHGGRDNARSWDPIAQALAADFRVIVPDLRGHGDSDWASDGIYGSDDFVQDLAVLVRDLDLPPCAMVGHSLGGNIVTRYAGLYPDRVTRLVNIEGLGDSPKRAAELALRDSIDTLRAWIERRIKLTDFPPRAFTDIAVLIERMKKLDARIPAETVRRLAEVGTRRNADGSVVLKYDPALGGPPPSDISQAVQHQLWKAITCPVLLVYGDESWASNPAIDGRAAHFRDARVALVERAGHWIQHDREAFFIDLVRDFLR